MSGSTTGESEGGGKTASSSATATDSHGGAAPVDTEAAAAPSEEENNSGYADPESPSSKADSTTSSSEGVLVEHPAGAEQDPRGVQGDQDGGILVNIDGSMLEHAEEVSSRRDEDLGGEEMFVDAPNQLGFVDGRRSVGLDESMAVIEIGENTRERCLAGEVTRLRAQLDEREAECGRYKEEQELLQSEIMKLQYHLRDLVDHGSQGCGEVAPEHPHQAEIYEESGVDRNLVFSPPLHDVVGQCSELALYLRGSMDELVQSKAMVKELRGNLSLKGLEIEDLNAKLCENLLSHDVIASYLDSEKDVQFKAFRESSHATCHRMLAFLSSVVQESESSEGSSDEEMHLVEKKVQLLTKKYASVLDEIDKLAQCFGAVELDLATQPEDKLGLVFEVVRRELLEVKNNESRLHDKINELEEGKSEALKDLDRAKESLVECRSEIDKMKMEFEQAENRFLTVKEKLSIAVTKGKSLVQQRDSLKQSLKEKTIELENTLQELQQKSVALEAAEGINKEMMHNEELVRSLETEISKRNQILQSIESDISEVGFPEDLQSADVTERIRWLIDQKSFSEEKETENNKIRSALSSFDLPDTVSGAMLDYQINWLGAEFSKTREDASNLQNELMTIQSALGSCESQLLQARKEMENLTETLFITKQGKDSIQMLYEELTSEYEGVSERLSQALSEKKDLVKVLGDISEMNAEEETPVDIDAFKDKCIVAIKEKVKASLSSLSLMEGLQRMQEMLYVRSQELILCENMLEEEHLSQSEKKSVSEELQRTSLEIVSLRNERDALQKDLERSEERSSLLKEKLSMAVKKGKGLVQEREGLKQAMDEKNTEIENLKKDLKSKESAVVNHLEQIGALKSDLKESLKLKFDMKTANDQIELALLESKNMLNKITESIEQIVVPSNMLITNPIEKLNLIMQYINECKDGKAHVEQELEKQKQEASLHGKRLDDAFSTIKSMEDELIEKEKHLSSLLEEKNSVQVVKDSMELELEKRNEEYHTLSVELENVNEALDSLKDALAKAENRISLLLYEKSETESKSKLAIASLNMKLATCMKELAGTHGNFETQSAEIDGHLRQFRLLVNDGSLPSLMAEVFRKIIEAIRKIIPLAEDISSQISLEESQEHYGLELKTSLSRLLSLPLFEEHDDKILSSNTSIVGSVEKMVSFTEVGMELSTRTSLLKENIEHFYSDSNYIISNLLQFFESTRDWVIHLVEQKEALKCSLHNLDVLRDSQEKNISKLQTDVKVLLSACSETICTLDFDLSQMMDADMESKTCLVSSLDSEFRASEACQSSSQEPENTAQKLILAARRVKGQIEHLPTLKTNWSQAIENLKNKLNDAELVSESAKEHTNLHIEKVTNLEKELNSLMSLSNVMKSSIEAYQAKEFVWKNKEEELSSLQHLLSMKNREEGKRLISDDQLEFLLAQVDRIEIPFSELELKASDQQLSNPVDKVLYILNNVAALKQMINSLVNERDALLSAAALHGSEVQRLKNIFKNFSSEELEEKIKDMNDVTIKLEEIVQKLGGGGSSEEKKAPRARDILSLLENIILSLREESESFRLRTQELGTKLLSSQNVVDELSAKVRSLEDSIKTQSSLQETKERSLYDGASTSRTGLEISEIEDVGSVSRKPTPVPAAAHVRPMRKGSSDHLALNIDVESDQLISSYEIDDKGHLFKSLNSSGLVPKQGKMVADRIDSIWVSGGRFLMGRPEARMGLIAYSVLLHLWALAIFI